MGYIKATAAALRDRGTGKTSRQIQQAPKGAIFVWCNGHLLYPQALAKYLGREDLRIVGPGHIASQAFRGSDKMIVVDHAAALAMDCRDAIRAHNESRTTS